MKNPSDRNWSIWLDKDSMSYAAIGRRYGISRQRAQQIYANVCRYLHRNPVAVPLEELLDGQKPLGTEFEAVWDANAAALYES